MAKGKITIKFPDGSTKEFEQGTTAMKIVEGIGPRLAKEAVGALVNGEPKDLDCPITKNSEIKILTFKDEEGKDIFRHSSAHLMAQAVLRLFPEAKLTIGPVVEEGFYYDIDHAPFNQEDVAKIEAEMAKIVKEDIKITRKEMPVKEAILLFKNNPYKQEILKNIEEFGEGKTEKSDTVSIYSQGEFSDLCRGPHLPSTGMIKAFKIIKQAGAYWRGNANNKQLQRLYGISFPDNKGLNEYLVFMEEAKKRDHKILGKQLDLYEIREEIGPGLIIWLPKGNIIKEELEKWMKATEDQWGYQRVTTPIITKEGLFHTSEHLPHYSESMFPPMILDNEKYYIKPMNCPFHHMVFKSRARSYRELPLRIAEYGWCHRYEDSGALFGMMRVRGMQMNDAHIYCTKEQAVDEFINVIKLHQYVYNVLGITEYWMELSLRDPKSNKYHGDDAMWVEAEELMRVAMEKSKVPYKVVIGGAAFYGPKIDFQIKSAIGKEFTASTNQIDLFMPGKFGLKYAASDGTEKTPVVIHRAPLGTHERFVGFLIEHFAGKFPLWLNPVQAKILTIADRHQMFADVVYEELKSAGIRAEKDYSAETLNKKIRNAQLEQINYILVVGDKESEEKTVNVRTRDGKVHGTMKLEQFKRQLMDEIKQKK